MRKNLNFRASRVGSRAYWTCDKWHLGFHKFETDIDIIYRLCYLRTRKHTYYIQFSRDKGELYERAVD